jgi:hypothetical protein
LKNLFWIVVIILPVQGWAQNVYKLKYHVDIPVTTLGAGSLAASYLISNHKKSTPPTEHALVLNKDDIWRIDRRACSNWSPKCGQVSDVLLYSSIAMPSLLLINKNVRREKYVVGMMYAETMLLSAGVTCLVKEAVSRNRPYMYNEIASESTRTSKDAQLSFFSGHTSLAATSSFFMAKVYCDLNPNSRLKPLVWTAACALPATVGVLRYTAGKHYPTDILVGYVTGAAIGYLVPYLHKKRAEKLEQPAPIAF